MIEWTYNEVDSTIRDESFEIIAYVTSNGRDPRPNGPRIVEAVNAHEGLEAALHEIERNCAPWAKADNMAARLAGIARAALAKVEPADREETG